MALALAAVAAAPASAATSGWNLIASGQRYALYSTVSIAATATRPVALALRAVPEPSQDVRIRWAMSCKTGGGRRTRTGSYVSRAPTLRRLRLPTPRPRSCSVSARGQLSGGGTLTLKLFAQPVG